MVFIRQDFQNWHICHVAYISWFTFIYLCVLCYCDACLKSSALCVGVNIIHNTHCQLVV